MDFYKQQNFEDNKVLFASQLNKIDTALVNINPFLGSELGDGLYSPALLKQGDTVVPMWTLISSEKMYNFDQIGTKVAPHNIYSYKSLYGAKCTQDGAICNDKIFLGQGNGTSLVLDVKTGASLGTMTYDKKDILLPHDNSMGFNVLNSIDDLLETIIWETGITIDAKSGDRKTGSRVTTKNFPIKNFSNLSITVTSSDYVICCYDNEGTYLGQPNKDGTALGFENTTWVAANTITNTSEILTLNPNVSQIAIISYNSTMPSYEITTSDTAGIYLYTNIYNSYASATDKHLGECCVYKINDMDTYANTLAQVIKVGFVNDVNYWPPANHSRPYGNFIVDSDNGLLYAYVMYDNVGIKWYKFNLPAMDAGEYNSTYGCNVVTLTTNDILDSWVTEYHHYIQGACCHNGLLYATNGITNGSGTYAPTVRVIDPTSHQEIATFHVAADGITDEAECIDFYEGKLHYGTPHYMYVFTLY